MPVARQSSEERRGHTILCPPFSRLFRFGPAILVHRTTDVARVGYRRILHGTRLQRRKRILQALAIKRLATLACYCGLRC